MKRKTLLFAIIISIAVLLTGCREPELPFQILYDENEDYAHFIGIDKNLTLDEANEFLSGSGWSTGVLEIMTLRGIMELNGEYLAEHLSEALEQFPGYEWEISIDYDSNDEYMNKRLYAYKHEATEEEIESAVKVLCAYMEELTDWMDVLPIRDSVEISRLAEVGSEAGFEYYTENSDPRIILTFKNQENFENSNSFFAPYNSTFFINIKMQ
jgi:hypothetical protein